MIPRFKILFLIVGLIFGVHCRSARVGQAETLMGTLVEITAEGRDHKLVKARVALAFEEVRRVDRLMSTFREDSELSRINRAAGVAPVQVSPEVLEAIERSLEVSRLSDGAFDISYAALGGLWDFSGEKPARVPEAAEIAARLKRVGWRRIQVDRSAGTVFLPEAGMRLDLGAIAKGYAVDRALAALKVPGVDRALVTAGGDLRAFTRPGEKPWRIGIQDPARRDRLLGELEIQNQAVATSGQYERFVEIQGRRYGHILDPRTGRPAEGVLGATVIAGEAWEADAWATALLVLGPEQGIKLLPSPPGIEALIVDAKGRWHATPGLAGRIQPAPSPSVPFLFRL